MIRRYKDKDLSQLLDSWYSASQVAHPFLDERFLAQERREIAETYLPNSETWVYELDGRVVGFISLVGNEVGGIFVDARIQRQGIGRALMDKARGMRDYLELDVFENNRIGRNFYKKYGFVQIAESVHDQTGFTQFRLKLVG